MNGERDLVYIAYVDGLPYMIASNNPNIDDWYALHRNEPITCSYGFHLTRKQQEHMAAHQGNLQVMAQVMADARKTRIVFIPEDVTLMVGELVTFLVAKGKLRMEAATDEELEKAQAAENGRVEYTNALLAERARLDQMAYIDFLKSIGEDEDEEVVPRVVPNNVVPWRAKNDQKGHRPT